MPPFFPQSSSPKQPLIYFLSLYTYLFVHFLVMASCVSLCSLSVMFSRLIHGVACISISSTFIAEYDSVVRIYSILFIHSPVDECLVWVVSTFWLLWIILLWTFMLTCLCEHILSVLLGFYLGVEFLGLTVTLFNILRNCQIVFQWGRTILSFYQQCMRIPTSSHHCRYLLLPENRIVLNENKKSLK